MYFHCTLVLVGGVQNADVASLHPSPNLTGTGAIYETPERTLAGNLKKTQWVFRHIQDQPNVQSAFPALLHEAHHWSALW